MVHLKKERIPKGKYTKLHMKKIDPFQIIKQCGPNAYKISFSIDICLSPIFNVSKIYAYKYYSFVDIGVVGSIDSLSIDVLQGLPKQVPPTIECILEKRVSKQIRRHTYHEYLVQWQGKPLEHETRMTPMDIEKTSKISNIPTQGT